MTPKEKKGKKKEMTEDSYLEWIEQFTLFDLVGAANSTAIVEFFMAASNSTVEAKKKEP